MVHASTWLDKVTPLWLFYFCQGYFLHIAKKDFLSDGD